MTDRLHPFLLALTLLDLAFVHATGAVSGLSMLPLWLLALASPWLRRLQRHRLYRFAWNGGVLIVFASLVHHATTSGLLHMLEDGLILAVLCQVHLINNVGERQRPDLTFFNSFLIAFVTSFFAPDLSWSLLFVLHCFALLPGLQLYVLTRRERVVDAHLVRSLVLDSLPRTVVVGLVTAVVFLLWPRDFHRRGWIGDALDLGQQLEAGLAERIEIGNDTKTGLSDEVVVRIEAIDGSSDSIPSHWRALAFAEFDGRTWFPQDAGQLGSRFATDVQWERFADSSWRRPARGQPRASLRVHLIDPSARQLLLPLPSTRVRPEHATGRMFDPKTYGGFALLRAEDVPPGPLVYTVDVARVMPTAALSTNARAIFTSLPEHGVPRLAYDLGTQIRKQLPPDADHLAIANGASQWLEHNRRYQLPGEAGFAGNLGEFLVGTGTGHCEYFATALALLLRTQGVPCRLVGGYLAHEPHPDGRSLIVRARDAHAWVEVLAADGSWHTFDATPAADLMRDARLTGGFVRSLTADLEAMWAAIAAFDADARTRWLLAIATWPVHQPISFGLVLATIALLLYRRRRQRQRLPAIARFERALRTARLALRPGETPRELLARAAEADVAPETLALVRTAALAHEQQRYRALKGHP